MELLKKHVEEYHARRDQIIRNIITRLDGEYPIMTNNNTIDLRTLRFKDVSNFYDLPEINAELKVLNDMITYCNKTYNNYMNNKKGGFRNV